MYKNKKRTLIIFLAIYTLIFRIDQIHAADDLSDLFAGPDNGQQALETQQPGLIQQAWQGLLGYARPTAQTAGTFARRFFPTLRRLVYILTENDVKKFAKAVTDPKYMPDKMYVQTKINQNSSLLDEYASFVNDAIYGYYEGVQSEYLLDISRLYFWARDDQYPNVVTTNLINTFEEDFLNSMEKLIQDHYPANSADLTLVDEAGKLLSGFTNFGDPSLFDLPVDLFCKVALSSFFKDGLKYRISVLSEGASEYQYTGEYQIEIDEIRQQFPLTPVGKNKIVNALKRIRGLFTPIRKQ